MRKLFVFFALLVSLIGLASCGSTVEDGTYNGEFVEATAYGEYSAKVVIEVKGGKIDSIVILNDQCHIYTDSAYWTESALWTDNVQGLLDSYKGVKVADIIKSETSPVDAIAGATQSSDRLYVAIRNAFVK